MSRLYDTVEPSVIDEQMLVQAVEEQGPKEEAGRIAKEEGIEFVDVRSLRLDFKNILRIDGLWEFVNLTKLQLDNNIIERIEGIDMLVHLVWLDLSFNNIEMIEGLDTLTKLEDLTLFNNRIRCIENMDTLVHLQVFSIGNNDLDDLDNLRYLRGFKELRSLNLVNNPMCDLENYKVYVAAFLPDLQFLDYRLLDDETKAASYEQHQIQIEELLDNERKSYNKAEDAAQCKAAFEKHKKAYVELLDGSTLFDSLFEDDPEGQKLNEMPGVEEILALYRDKFNLICQNIFNFGLREYEKREQEVEVFWTCVNEEKMDNKALCMAAIDKFFKEKKEMFEDLDKVSEPLIVEQKLEEHRAMISDLWYTLMGYEMQLVDQLEDVIGTFERSMQDMVSTFVEDLQGFMVQIRECESLHNERIVEIATTCLDRLMKNDLEEEISDELRMVLVDKDTVMNSVSTSHEAHLLKIDNREDDMVTRINNWCKNMVETIQEEQELLRNRARVTEINHLIEHLREDLEGLELVNSSSQ